MIVTSNPKTLLKAALATAIAGVVATAFASPTYAGSDEPEYFQVNMKPGGSLNIREDPTLKSTKIGTLPATAEGITNLGCHVGMPYLEWKKSTTAVRKVETRRKWCNITYNGMTGWTVGEFLEEDVAD
ncbi:SH3 domain-containing protein [Sneathiella marina]|uniref:SH3 domain-containing protein n=1 Tax=Sneathiella marina TaxID=2950108 RepID=A0ABY4WB37_9PROT|nr:SH3 domain-containing protein [Sneathiella marina]USG63137.1 SH3 domain-containing protein [Sneathiella marina]